MRSIEFIQRCSQWNIFNLSCCLTKSVPYTLMKGQGNALGIYEGVRLDPFWRYNWSHYW